MRTTPMNRDKALFEYLVAKYGRSTVKNAMFSIIQELNKTKNNNNNK